MRPLFWPLHLNPLEWNGTYDLKEGTLERWNLWSPREFPPWREQGNLWSVISKEDHHMFLGPLNNIEINYRDPLDWLMLVCLPRSVQRSVCLTVLVRLLHYACALGCRYHTWSRAQGFPSHLKLSLWFLVQGKIPVTEKPHMGYLLYLLCQLYFVKLKLGYFLFFANFP